jgi:hypothetical protein
LREVCSLEAFVFNALLKLGAMLRQELLCAWEALESVYICGELLFAWEALAS